MNFKLTTILILTAALAGCRADGLKEAAVGQGVSAEWFNAKYPSDLGPGLVDVREYPVEMKDNYRLFLAVCSACHTPARALNSPYASEFDWKRYVHRMHVKVSNLGFVLSPEQEKRIVNFLVYDSKIRKIDRKEEFELQAAIMKQLYEDVARERETLTLAETRAMSKRETPYVGVK